MNDFQGLNALVTGGASGIGAATVEELVSRGAAVSMQAHWPRQPLVAAGRLVTRRK